MSRQINAIVIHCAASPNGQRVTAEDVDRWHKERGFQRRDQWRGIQNPQLYHIGYHFLVRINGAIESGRHLEEVGAHVAGSNSDSIGICMAGTDRFTPAQWASLADCVRSLSRKFPRAKILGHRDYSPDKNGDGVLEPWEWMKTCPGFDVAHWLNNGMKPAIVHLLDPDPAHEG